ncbi:MAG TPA: hypothetical protein VHP30_04715, partial [Ignavibacteriales bacterium]|nr:hypothetical protein [Ignavibacteriales bacterium]
DESVKIYEELTNTVSKPYLLIITSPNLIRAVILRKELKHVMPNIKGPYEPAPGYGDYTEYTALVVKRYKRGSLKAGDTLLISVSSQNWKSPYPEFNEGDEYLLSLTYPSYGKYLLTNQNNKKERASFLIKDNILYDRNGFWGMGTKAPWDKFEAAFMKDINRLRSDPPPEFLYD